MKIFVALSWPIALLMILALLWGGNVHADEPGPTPVSTNASVAEPASQEMIEKLQREIAVQVARHTETITSNLAGIGPTLNRIQQQQAGSSQDANRTLLIAAGLFAVAGFLGLGFLTMTSVKAMARFSELALASAGGTRRPLLAAPGEAPAALPEPAMQPNISGSAERASARFQGALEHLEKRIIELEHSSHPAQPDAVRSVLSGEIQSPITSGNLILHPLPAPPSISGTQAASVEIPRSEMLMGKGQALLNLDQAAAALKCFAMVLAENPDNTDALIRQGMAFEKIQEWERALQSYDRALALDDSLTLAHLHKGGVCNQLLRHREALECYEKALGSEPKEMAP
jgi:tetratricopeptide (TPR) repeat protein